MDGVFQMTEEHLVKWRQLGEHPRANWWYFSHNNKLYGPYTTEHKADVSFEVLQNRLASCAGGSCE